MPPVIERAGARWVWPLFLGLLALYLATSGGHTTSNDEEELYYVTQGLVERGSLALPPDEARALAIPRGAALGPDGSYYTPYGLLPSVLAIPLYLLGRAVAAAYDPAFQGFFTRAAVTALSALATAGGAALVALLARALGASVRGAALVGLLYGTTTIAWPYARALWSEPVATLLLLAAALAAVHGSRGNRAMLWLLASLALGLAVATRSAMLAVVPAFALYLLVGCARGGGWRSAALRLARQGTGFAAGFLLPALALGAYNLARFGSALENGTGFGRQLEAALAVFGGNPWLGLYGLLLSPGKSVFLYSPPLLAGALALVTLWRRPTLRPEALLLTALVVLQVALAAPLVFWHGDAAWGPRYLVPATPFLLLPVAAWLAPEAVRPGRAWQRALLAGSAVAGLLVQLLGVLANPHTYILATGGPDGPGAERRWFDPAASPLLAAPRQLAERAGRWREDLPPGSFTLGDGFYPPEIPTATFPRWTGGRAAIRFRAAGPGPGELRLELVQPEPNGPRPLPELALELDGTPLPPADWQVARTEAGRYSLVVPLPPLSAAPHTLALRSPVFIPALLEPGSQDRRALGVDVLDARVLAMGGVLRRVDLPAIPPLPVSAAQPWGRAAFGWFYDPSIPHLVDLWPWYVARAGLHPPDAGLRGCVERCALVQRAYREVLGREPDLDGWRAYILGGLDEAPLRAELCASAEGRARGCQSPAGGRAP